MKSHTQEYIIQLSNEIRERWFVSHKAVELKEASSINPSAIVIAWSNPASWNYGCRFIIHRRWLIVVGDIGEAIYEWGNDVSLAFLAGIDFGYFKGKCQASEVGRDFDEWDDNVAELYRKDRIAELEGTLKEDRGESDDKERELLSDISQANKEDYTRVAQEFFDETGDAEGAGAISEMGIVPNGRCLGHFIGIQMAIKQLQDNGLISKH